MCGNGIQRAERSRILLTEARYFQAEMSLNSEQKEKKYPGKTRLVSDDSVEERASERGCVGVNESPHSCHGLDGKHLHYSVL